MEGLTEVAQVKHVSGLVIVSAVDDADVKAVADESGVARLVGVERVLKLPKLLAYRVDGLVLRRHRDLPVLAADVLQRLEGDERHLRLGRANLKGLRLHDNVVTQARAFALVLQPRQHCCSVLVVVVAVGLARWIGVGRRLVLVRVQDFQILVSALLDNVAQKWSHVAVVVVLRPAVAVAIMLLLLLLLLLLLVDVKYLVRLRLLVHLVLLNLLR